MNAQDLKNSILQLAIQGKLVEQREEEGTARELLEQIKTEKELLIKDKKIKKEKPLPAIIENEIPFDIPESWEWARLGELITYKNGYAYKSTDMNSIQKGYPVIKSGSIMSLKVVVNSKTDYIENPTEKMVNSLIVKNDMLMCLSSQSNNPEPLGKTAIYEFDEPALLNQRVLKMKALLEELIKYLYYTINSHYFHYNVSHQGGGSAQANLKLDHVLYMLIPLPPLEEQKRIVSKIKELMPYVEKYDKVFSEVEELNKKFPEDMQKSILQYAIQGKLVEQREEEGAAEELYKQIREEMERKIKEGKIKKQKPLPEIKEDEMPFDIPDSWKWVRLGSLSEKIGSGSTPTGGNSVYKESGIKFLRSQNIYNDGLRLENVAYISEDQNKPGSTVKAKDILLNITGGSIGRCALVPDDFDIANINQHVMIIRNLLPENRHFLHYILISPYVQSMIMNVQVGVSREGLSAEKLKNFMIPLPPLKEQKRIVSKIKELMPCCKKLEK